MPAVIAGAMRHLQAACSALALVLLVSLQPSSVRADNLTECVAGWAKSALDPDEILEALEFLGKYGHCVPLIADPSGQFAAITAALAIAKEKKVFKTVSECENLIPQLAADVVVYVADNVGDVIGFKIPKYVKDQGEAAVKDWVNQQANKPPVNTIVAEMKCGCAVATHGSDQFKKVIGQVVETAEACAGLVGDIAALGKDIANKIAEALEDAAKDLAEIGQVALDLLEDCLGAAAGQKSVIECLEDFPDLAKALTTLVGGAAGKAIDAFVDGLNSFLGFAKAACCGTAGKIWGGFCGGCSPPPKPTPPKVDLNCQGVLCPKGQQCGGELNDRCVLCNELGFVAYGKTDGMCGCEFGYDAKYKSTAGGPVLTACKCDPPKKVWKHPDAPTFSVPRCQCPIQGQVEKYKKQKITQKIAGIPITYEKDVLYCDCPWGERVQDGKCEPIQCPPKQYVKADGKSCTDIIHLSDQPPPSTVTTPAIPPCPVNYHWDGAKCVYGGPTVIQDPLVPVKPAPRTPACPANFRWDGTRCVPPGAATGPAKPGTARTTPTIPPCPANTVWDGAKCAPVPAIQAKPKTPACPANTRWDGKRCAPVAATTVVPRTVAPTTTLPSCPPNTKWDGRGCAPVPTIQRAPTVTTPGPAIALPQCPQGTRWDGQRCAPVVTQPAVPLGVPPPARQLSPQIVR